MKNILSSLRALQMQFWQNWLLPRKKAVVLSPLAGRQALQTLTDLFSSSFQNTQKAEAKLMAVIALVDRPRAG